jgi:hypothetical protein
MANFCCKSLEILTFAVRPEGADYQWRKVPPGVLNITIDEVQPGATYTYNFQNGNGTGDFDPVKSQQPATPCVILGCTGPILSTNADFDLFFTHLGTVSATFEDNGETYSGTAFVAVSKSVPEPSTWAMMLGFAAVGFADYCMPGTPSKIRSLGTRAFLIISAGRPSCRPW